MSVKKEIEKRIPQINRRKVRQSLSVSRKQRREGTSYKDRRGMPRKKRVAQPRVRLEKRIRQLENLIHLHQKSSNSPEYKKAAEEWNFFDPDDWKQYVTF